MKIRTLLSIIKTEPEDPNVLSLGFIQNGKSVDSIMSTIKKNEGSALTALKMAKEYIDVEVDWLDIQPVGFFDKEDQDTVILAYRVRIPATVSMIQEPFWVTMEDLKDVHEQIDPQELLIQLRSISV
tara:strand:+ start:19675 stop:20055 length:381 start_codon:yes stop_codon:yes gene_type:complete